VTFKFQLWLPAQSMRRRGLGLAAGPYQKNLENALMK
jgi:hypothetical protein